MPEMMPSEIETFLAAPRHAIVATNTVDGPPQISPVWYVYEEGTLYISAGVRTAKHYNLRRDPRISVCIDGGHPDYRTVTFYGTVTLIPPGDPRQEAMRRRIIRRYYESEAEAQRYYDAVRDQPSVLIVVTPEKIITQDFN